MKSLNSLILAFFVALLGLDLNAQDNYRYRVALESLVDSKSEQVRFYVLGCAAKGSFTSGKLDEARSFSVELLDLAPKFQQDWNYGNAIHDGNMVLGRIAIKEGKVAEAISYLIKAGHTPGSAQLNSFGPNMNLAKDLLEIGEKEAVIEYLKLCGKFWSHHEDYLNKWIIDINHNRIPDFKANLFY